MIPALANSIQNEALSVEENYCSFDYLLTECPQFYCGEIQETLTFSYKTFLPESLS
jgi:hypothetical protein